MFTTLILVGLWMLLGVIGMMALAHGLRKRVPRKAMLVGALLGPIAILLAIEVLDHEV